MERSNGPWRRFQALANDSPAKTVIMTLAVAFLGSVLVAGSAVLLRPLQIANKEAERRARVAEIVAQLDDGEALKIEARVVDLASGRYVTSMDPLGFDQRRAARDPELSLEIPAQDDLAGLKRRARFAVVYLAQSGGRTRAVVLPVRGSGFASMIYGYIGLAADANTVVGISFYEHAETPGLGSLIDSPAWKRQWQGKKVRDEGELLRLGVGRGRIEPGSEAASYQVDGLTGATWTGLGVTNLLHYWLDENGFGPYLRKLRRRQG
ncbi:MAG: Na(+)-translocating NADH-quinone reductase subunit C [Alphaproteobacteria bacterium]|jgi:Na+-transporting NADH:ubiquinone oxidoreductase subunit C|nr:Na(+)-translocating NADH-quinone reductase subunit C [Alphaproteobacteria bacterium]